MEHAVITYDSLAHPQADISQNNAASRHYVAHLHVAARLLNAATDQGFIANEEALSEWQASFQTAPDTHQVLMTMGSFIESCNVNYKTLLGQELRDAVRPLSIAEMMPTPGYQAKRPEFEPSLTVNQAEESKRIQAAITTSLGFGKD